ncbi:MAG: YceI family protein [Comamonadaceae bacterium]|nr:YceI family protein [Comamonadaceae bacterium]
MKKIAVAVVSAAPRRLRPGCAPSPTPSTRATPTRCSRSITSVSRPSAAASTRSTGKIALDRAAKSGSIDVAIDTTSIDMGLDKWDEHMKLG